MNNSSPLPWYKHRFVWFIIAIPFSAVVMGAIMLWLAVTSDDGLVTDDYYKEGLAINRNLERDALAAEKEISAELELDNERGVIKIIFNKGSIETYPDIFQLKMQFATHANNDVQVDLHHGQDNKYIGYLKKSLLEGKWYFELSDDKWRLNAHANIKKNINISFKP